MDVLYPCCAGLDVHKDSVVAAVRLAADGPAKTEVRTFDTTTPGLLALSAWLAECGCTHVAMEATGIYWKPVWHILADGQAASATSVLRPGTFFTCAALARISINSPSARICQTGCQ